MDSVELYVLFPDFHSIYRLSHELTAEEFRILWDDVLGPSIAGLSDEDGVHDTVTPSNLPYLATTMRVLANASEFLWLRHMVFVDLIRSQSSRHPLLKDYLYKHHISIPDLCDVKARGGV